MSSSCSDIQNTLYAYLDDELANAELLDFEHHLSGCENCKKSCEEALQAHADLRRHLQATPEPSKELVDKIRISLNKEERFVWRQNVSNCFSLPNFATTVAFAMLAFFVWTHLFQQPLSSQSSMASSEALAMSQTGQSAPLQVMPASKLVQAVAQQHWNSSSIVNAVQTAPVVGRALSAANTLSFQPPNISLLGWLPAHVEGQQSATFVYEVRANNLSSRVHVHAIRKDLVPLHRQSKLQGMNLWVDQAMGVHTVTVVKGALAYVFSSRMKLASLVALVSNSKIVPR